MSLLLLFKGAGTGPTIVEGDGASAGSGSVAALGVAVFAGVSVVAGVASSAFVGAARALGTAVSVGLAAVAGIAPQDPTEADASASGLAVVSASSAFLHPTVGASSGTTVSSSLAASLTTALAACTGLGMVLGESDSAVTMPMGRMRRRFVG